MALSLKLRVHSSCRKKKKKPKIFRRAGPTVGGDENDKHDASSMHIMMGLFSHLNALGSI